MDLPDADAGRQPDFRELMGYRAAVEPACAIWNAEIRRDGHEVVLNSADDGVGRLTKAESRKLDELSSRYLDFTDEDLIEETHGFGEWSRAFYSENPDSATPMTWEAALAAQGASDCEESIDSDSTEQRIADTICSELCSTY